MFRTVYILYTFSKTYLEFVTHFPALCMNRNLRMVEKAMYCRVTSLNTPCNDFFIARNTIITEFPGGSKQCLIYFR